MNQLLRLTLLANILFAFCSCSHYVAPIAKKNVAQMYNPSQTAIHPEFKVQIKGDSLANLLIRISRNELLYSRANKEGKLKSSIEITCIVYSDAEKEIVQDSISVSRDIVFSRNPVILSVVPLRILPERWQQVQVSITDKFRQQGYFGYTIINNSNTNMGKHMYTTLVDIDSQQPNERLSFYPWVPDSSGVKLYDSNSNSRHQYLRIYTDNLLTPELPFAETSDSLHYRPDTTLYLKKGIFWPQTPGLYFFSSDTSLSGIGLVKLPEHYPSLIKTSELIRPLVYLCSQQEFESIATSKNLKIAIDEFWFASAMDYHKAKQMIRVYYNRAKYANIYFTSVREGWRTDRGMIFLLFGPPEKVYRTNWGERWMYGTAKEYRTLTFDFEYVDTAFSDNHFRLRRQSNFRTIWRNAVKVWRTGNIFNGEEKIIVNAPDDQQEVL